MIEKCTLCPRKCKVNRYKTKGICGADYKIKVSNILLHKGEEPPISGKNGTGIVFFSGCPMKCIYCQNMGFSQKGIGKEISIEKLADAFLKLQERGAHTLDLVTPTQYVPQIIEALNLAKSKGFNIPVVYNTSSYENVETLKLLEGYVDIYLADIRYTNSMYGKIYSDVDNYWETAQESIKEMYRQVGAYNEEKRKGIIIRILVLPNNVSGHFKALRFILELDPNIPVSLMSQYIPHFSAKNDPLIGRKITKTEYMEAVEYMEMLGLHGWIQLDEKEKLTTKAVDIEW
ncbi:radical SAM protein [Thermosipho melanesiensis]|uniref:Radical SAM domain protein n=2 Tax=Thermosipho melanesiensis TaxID=46541 RepID=A6LM47_THEM4|nr:radical SAM protein [Thermosipho melanesiensis]ABR30998.1 Radical SAM domain protein [Thermosipho melanesiensis BI429]APT74095.1 radical SAM protein [Thermosipho melanesiensis]